MKMIHNRFARILSVFLAMITLFVVCSPVSIHAAAVGSTVKTATVDTSDSSYYIIKKNNVSLQSSRQATSSSYAKLSKNSLVQSCAKTGDYYEVHMNGRHYYVKSSNMEKAPKTYAASLYYTTKSAPLRATPYETGSKITTLPKGSVIFVVGSLVNSKGNVWNVVSYNNALFYMYSGNVKSCSKITLNVSGEADTLAVNDTLQLKCSVTPASVTGVVWSSSNDSIAKVDIDGKVTGVSPGSVTISASINGVIKTSYQITVFEYAIFPVKVMSVSQIGYESFSHRYLNAIDFVTGGYDVVAPFTAKVISVSRSFGYVVLQSTEKVRMADGTYDYCTISFMHDNDVSNLKVGQIIKQGKAFYQQGGMAATGVAYPNHVEMRVWRGKVSGSIDQGGNMFAFDALFIDPKFTTTIYNYGVMESGNKVYNGAPADYRGLWKKLP